MDQDTFDQQVSHWMRTTEPKEGNAFKFTFNDLKLLSLRPVDDAKIMIKTENIF